MTGTDQIKIFDNMIKSSQAQHDLGRKATKISALSSNDLLGKYEYLTGEDLGHKPSVFGKVKFQCSPLGITLINNTETKANKNKVYSKNKQDKYLIYNLQYSFPKFKYIDEFKELLLNSTYKRLNDCRIRFNKLKTVSPQTDENKVLREKVFDDVGGLVTC